MMFAKFSPDGTRVAFVSNNNIYVEDVASGQITQLTHDGSQTIVNGTFDWVYEEEFACRDGFRWSPDGQYIAYWQSDTKGTGVFDIINNVDSIYPTILHFPYPKAGSTNSAVKVGYLPAAGGATTWIEIPGDPRNNYIPRMEFIPGSNELFIQQMNRPQYTSKYLHRHRCSMAGHERQYPMAEGQYLVHLGERTQRMAPPLSHQPGREGDTAGYERRLRLYIAGRDGSSEGTGIFYRFTGKLYPTLSLQCRTFRKRRSETAQSGRAAGTASL